MKKTMIKKALGVALALAMVPGLGGTALAEDITVNGNDGADVNAMFVPDPTIEATVSWGNMNFTFTEKTNSWSVANADDNMVSVKNMSPHRGIDVSVQYEDYDETQAGASDNIDSTIFMPHIFNSAIESFDVNRTPDGDVAVTPITLATRLARGDTAQGWLMFTNGGNLYNDSSLGADELGTGDFSKIGTLKVTVDASDATA